MHDVDQTANAVRIHKHMSLRIIIAKPKNEG